MGPVCGSSELRVGAALLEQALQVVGQAAWRVFHGRTAVARHMERHARATRRRPVNRRQARHGEWLGVLEGSVRHSRALETTC